MNRLKYLRTESELTQIALAQAINTSQRNIGRWEKDEIEMGANFAVKIAQFFNVSVEYLLGYTDDLGFLPNEKNSPTLTNAEEDLLSTYRTMPKSLQEIALDTMHSLAGNTAGKTTKRA
jgi:transcriptional regulator with XRE-family HTH domain